MSAHRSCFPSALVLRDMFSTPVHSKLTSAVKKLSVKSGGANKETRCEFSLDVAMVYDTYPGTTYTATNPFAKPTQSALRTSRECFNYTVTLTTDGALANCQRFWRGEHVYPVRICHRILIVGFTDSSHIEHRLRSDLVLCRFPLILSKRCTTSPDACRLQQQRL